MAKIIDDATLRSGQNRVFHYRQKLASGEFNRLLSKTVPTGVYEGGNFIYKDEESFYIEPFSIVIPARDPAYDIAARIKTTDTFEATISQSLSSTLIVARFDWAEGQDVFLQILQVTEDIGTQEGVLNANDIILGRLNLTTSGGRIVLQGPETSFDYTVKQWSPLSKEILRNTFYVRAASLNEDSDRVYVMEAGEVRVKKGLTLLNSNASPKFDPTTTPRTDFLYIDDNGVLQVQKGSSAAVPNFYGKKVLAIISRGANRTDIQGNDIRNVVDIPIGSQDADTFLIKNNQSYYTGLEVTVEEALKQVWEKATRRIFEEPEMKVFRNSGGLRIDSGANKDQLILKASNVGSNSRNITIQTPAGSLSSNRTVFLPDADVTLVQGTMVSASDVDQTIKGLKTFSLPPRIETDPLDSRDLVHKNYVDVVDNKVDAHINLSLSESGDLVHGLRLGHSSSPENESLYFNVDRLDGQHGSFYRNASNMDTGTLPKGRLSGSYDISVATAENTTGNSGTASKLKNVNSINGDTNYHNPSNGNLTLKTYVAGNSASGVQYPLFVTSTAGGSLDVRTNSNISVSGSEIIVGNLKMTSSRLKKKDILDYEGNALEIVNSAQIVSYKFKDDPNERVHIGVIAEDAPKELVSDDRKTIETTDILGILLKAVQELSARIDVLERR